MKTKRRTLIVLLVFVLAAGAALALLTHANQKAEQAASEAEDGSIPLLDVTTATLESVSIQYGGETLTLRLSDDGWTLTEDPAYHLDDSACSTIRTEGCPSAPAVASAIALGSFGSCACASVNQTLKRAKGSSVINVSLTLERGLVEHRLPLNGDCGQACFYGSRHDQ